jgi:hypothetical protein
LVEETGVPEENHRPTAKNERKIMLSMLRWNIVWRGK